jgi:rhamnosyltransferase
MEVAVIGTRGIPARYGGFETFAEEISQLLVLSGYKVTVQCDPNDNISTVWNGVDLFYSPVTKSKHPLRYYYYGLKYSLKKSDLIIVAGTGGALFYFLNLFRRKILITNTDGIEYKRSKWSFLHRMFLRFTEQCAVHFSDIVIADSESIKKHLISKYNFSEGKIRVIEYGSRINKSYDVKILERYKLTFKSYYLVVCRLEPENNLTMIIEGYLKSGSEFPLVIVGAVTGTPYVRKLTDVYGSDKIIFTGGVYDKAALNSMRYGCKAYLHGHTVGGTNPSLLEAMGNGNIIVCHDNLFNREVSNNGQLYFTNSDELSGCLQKVEKLEESEAESYALRSYNRIMDYYNWGNIIRKYSELLSSLQTVSKV